MDSDSSDEDNYCKVYKKLSTSKPSFFGIGVLFIFLRSKK